MGENGTQIVCKLIKRLYGLKQSPRNWSSTLSQWLAEHGFTQAKSDAGVFVSTTSHGTYILVVYVDDIIIVGPSIDWICNFKAIIQQKFSIKDLGQAEWILGISVSYDKKNKTLKLQQSKYIDDLLCRFGMVDCKPASTPAVSGMVLGASSKLDEVAAKKYRSLVGSLLYAATSTRPDIAYSVSYLSRFMANPDVQHLSAAKRVLRYLKGTKEKGLVYSGNAAAKSLIGYSDADWAGDSERRSTSGYVFFMHGATISWKSQRQQTVALSTAESEYMALCSAAKEATFLTNLGKEIGCLQTEPCTIYDDNQSCIFLAKNPVSNSRTKHIDIQYHFTREKVATKDIDIVYCPSEEMIADIMTKPLALVLHEKLSNTMLSG